MRHVKEVLKQAFGERPAQWFMAFITMLCCGCVVLLPYYYAASLSARTESLLCFFAAACLVGCIVGCLRTGFAGPIIILALPIALVGTVVFLSFWSFQDVVEDWVKRLMRRHK